MNPGELTSALFHVIDVNASNEDREEVLLALLEAGADIYKEVRMVEMLPCNVVQYALAEEHPELLQALFDIEYKDGEYLYLIEESIEGDPSTEELLLRKKERQLGTINTKSGRARKKIEGRRKEVENLRRIVEEAIDSGQVR